MKSRIPTVRIRKSDSKNISFFVSNTDHRNRGFTTRIMGKKLERTEQVQNLCVVVLLDFEVYSCVYVSVFAFSFSCTHIITDGHKDNTKKNNVIAKIGRTGILRANIDIDSILS